jgi:hypothetical protein
LGLIQLITRSKDEIIADCPCDSIYYIESNSGKHLWSAYNVQEKFAGYTTAKVSVCKGCLVILGYDFSSTKDILVCSQWREKFVELLKELNVELPYYGSGSIAVQCIGYSDKVFIMNYNSNKVTGDVNVANRQITVSLKPYETKFINR